VPYRLLADAVVAVHVLYVGFVVLGQLLVWLGVALRWRWVRNPWFRWAHLAMMTAVGVEAVFDITCPLTRWEAGLRALAGQEVAGESFVGRLLHGLIFVDLPPAALAAIHITFALLVATTFVFAPPRSFRRTNRTDQALASCGSAPAASSSPSHPSAQASPSAGTSSPR
jgi:hypothetical protein